MAFRTTPNLGPALDTVIKAGGFWYDIPGKGTLASPQYGNKEFGSDGRQYIWVKAGGAIAASTQVAIDASFNATTGGSSGYFTQTTPVVTGDSFWARMGVV